MDDSNELIIKKNWLERNWKWLVPTGCLGIIAFISLIIGVIYFGFTSMMQQSDAYKDALKKAQESKIVIEKLGKPLETDGMTMGSINVNGYTGNCDLQIPVKGPKGKGILFVVATKKVNWKFNQLSIVIENTDEEIDLLSHPQHTLTTPVTDTITK